MAADQKLMAVAVHAGQSLDPATPRQLFQFHGTSDFLGGSYDVGADGQRFLVSALVACRRVTITRLLASKLSWLLAAKSCLPGNSIPT